MLALKLLIATGCIVWELAQPASIYTMGGIIFIIAIMATIIVKEGGLNNE
jgi:hypothetical protein